MAAHVGRVAGGVACPRGGAFPGEGASWCPLRPVEGVVQRFPGCLWGVGDADAESQAVSAAWRGRDLVVGGVRRCPSDHAVVFPLHCPPDVPVFEHVDFCGGQGGVHCVPADRLDGADHRVGRWECSYVEYLVDFLGGRADAGGILHRLGWTWRGAVLPEPGGGRHGVHGCHQDVFRQPFHMRWLSPSRSRGMVASAFRVRSAMARWGPGVACVGSSGRRLSDGMLGGGALEGGWLHRQVFDKVERYGVVAVRRGQEVGVWVPR